MSRVQADPPCENIIKFYGYGVSPQRITLVMEFPQPCLPLSKFLRQNTGHLTEELARNILHQIIISLQHCNRCSVHHSNTHLSNMLINTETLQQKLTDFSRAADINAMETDGPGVSLAAAIRSARRALHRAPNSFRTAIGRSSRVEK
ncbi:hypothetical protein QQF64_023405 [Cirrhinus molitorella]|uniref:non-specific serine/threonine protein kinase n=1 Tax=Cirrhinus molitorella TaxID=172907 RepID=A0ABR3L541_9TELE